jgi:hypothetical protein
VGLWPQRRRWLWLSSGSGSNSSGNGSGSSTSSNSSVRRQQQQRAAGMDPRWGTIRMQEAFTDETVPAFVLTRMREPSFDMDTLDMMFFPAFTKPLHELMQQHATVKLDGDHYVLPSGQRVHKESVDILKFLRDEDNDPTNIMGQVSCFENREKQCEACTHTSIQQEK